MENVNEIWQHIMVDEKEHYGLFLDVLRKYDPVEYEQYVSHAKDTVKSSPLQEYRPEYDRQIILNNIRQDIKGEFEAVILYEQLIMEMPFDDIRDIFVHIITAEKEHAEHLTRLLLSLDTGKYNGLT